MEQGSHTSPRRSEDSWHGQRHLLMDDDERSIDFDTGDDASSIDDGGNVYKNKRRTHHHYHEHPPNTEDQNNNHGLSRISNDSLILLVSQGQNGQPQVEMKTADVLSLSPNSGQNRAVHSENSSNMDYNNDIEAKLGKYNSKCKNKCNSRFCKSNNN